MNVTGALALVVFRQQLLRVVAVDHAGLVLFGKWIHQHGGFTSRGCTDDDIGAPLLRDLAGVVVRFAGIAAALVKLFQHLRPELLALRRLDVGGIHLRQRTNFRHLRNAVDLLPAHIFPGGQPVDRRLQLRAGFGLLGGGALRFFRSLRFVFYGLIIRSFSCCVNAFRLRPRGRTRGHFRPFQRGFQPLLQSVQTSGGGGIILAALEQSRLTMRADIRQRAQCLRHEPRLNTGQTFQRILAGEHLAHPVRRDLLAHVVLRHDLIRLLLAHAALLHEVSLVNVRLFRDDRVQIVYLRLHRFGQRAAH